MYIFDAIQEFISFALSINALTYGESIVTRYLLASLFSYCGKNGESCISGKNIRSLSFALSQALSDFARFSFMLSVIDICTSVTLTPASLPSASACHEDAFLCGK